MDAVDIATHVALSELLVDIAWRIDHGHAATVHELFTADGVLDLGAAVHTGRDEIARWGADRPSDRRTRHVCTNARFAADGPGRARGTSVLTVHLGDGAGPPQTLVVDCIEEYVVVDGVWRVSARRLELVFAAGGE